MNIFPDAINVTETQKNPTQLLIIKKPKIGGTRLVCDLEDNHVIYFDGRADFYKSKAKVFNVTRNWEDFNKDQERKIPFDVYAVKYITELNKHCLEHGPIAKYITIDTVTRFEEISKSLALANYKKTAMGKSFTEEDITLLPMGAGYGRLRLAFQTLYDLLKPCCSKSLIFLAHPKSSSINIDGSEVSVQDIDLTGKLKLILSTQVDAVGTMHRAKGRNVNVLSFKTYDDDFATGGRSEHLQNKDIEISEILPDGTFVSHWDKIFI